jgi:hypothetical protein
MVSATQLIHSHNLESFQKLCKALAVLDAVFSQTWDYRYYSYNSDWDDNEEYFQMRNGEGDEIHVLFKEKGCIICGYANESDLIAEELLVKEVPEYFREFITDEPVKSTGATFCLWNYESADWFGILIPETEEKTKEMLKIFDSQAETYIAYASDYFAEMVPEDGIPIESVRKIYNKEILGRQLVLSLINENLEWDLLATDLDEIGYPYNFN